MEIYEKTKNKWNLTIGENKWAEQHLGLNKNLKLLIADRTVHVHPDT